MIVVFSQLDAYIYLNSRILYSRGGYLFLYATSVKIEVFKLANDIV